MLTLAKGFVDRGHSVDVVVVSAVGSLRNSVPQGARLIELGGRRVVYSVFKLRRYLRRERPAALLSTLNTANAVAVLARSISGQSTRVVIRQALNLSKDLTNAALGSALLEGLGVRWLYPRADAIAAVSRGVADDLLQRRYMRCTPIEVVPNPIVTNELRELANAPVEDDWLASGAVPVVLGVGRLNRQKRFDVLIRAFAQVRTRVDSRLLILGEGEERGGLEELVRGLGLQEVVRLPGFAANPFPAMARSSVFVLSSDFEGLPGVLIQALACGTAVVATDCDSGPSEILQGGRFGRLVPVNDVAAMADAISATLRNPCRGDVTEACLPYTESASVHAYARLLHVPA
jgi:glycosyltransferase involved in cell wall biosynthesis